MHATCADGLIAASGRVGANERAAVHIEIVTPAPVARNTTHDITARRRGTARTSSAIRKYAGLHSPTTNDVAASARRLVSFPAIARSSRAVSRNALAIVNAS